MSDIELIAIDSENLNEAGGIISWIRRAFTNVDMMVVEELKAEMSKIRTAFDKTQVLKELDEFLTEAKAAHREGVFGDIVRSLGFGSIGAGIGGGAGFIIGRATMPKSLNLGFWKGLAMKLAGVEAETLAAKQALHVTSKVTSGITIGLLSASLISITFKSINRLNGSLERYIQSLEALRAEIQAIKVKPGSYRENTDFPYEEVDGASFLLAESVGGFIRNLATGDIEDDVKELEEEASHISTPEQQRVVLMKVLKLLEKLIILRHNPSAVQKAVDASSNTLSRLFGNHKPELELKTRTGEAIAKLSRIRDKILNHKFADKESAEKVIALRQRAKEVIENAAKKEVDDL